MSRLLGDALGDGSVLTSVEIIDCSYCFTCFRGMRGEIDAGMRKQLGPGCVVRT